LYSFNHISNVLADGNSASEQIINHFIFDSRMHVINPKETMFVAFKSNTNDGHDFIPQLIQKGVTHFIIQDPKAVSSKAHFILVTDTLHAIQHLAAHFRMQTKALVVGITGSNGKTICKDALATIAKAAGKKVIQSPRSFNSQIGVAFSLLQLKQDTELAIIEAGISKPNEMQKLEAMIKPDIGIITHLGDAHQGNFETDEKKVQEKLTLFKNSRTVLINHSNPKLAIVQKNIFQNNVIEVIEVRHLNLNPPKITVNHVDYTCDKLDEVSIHNLLLAIRAAQVIGITHNAIQEGIFAWRKPQNRLTLLNGFGDSVIVNDSYTNDLAALEAAISFTNAHAGGKEKVAIITALEGAKQGDWVRTMLLHQGFAKVIAIGEGFESPFTKDTEAFFKQFKLNNFANKAVLVKGLRKYELEKISHWLEEKKNTTELIINLNKLTENYVSLKKLLAPKTKTLVMLKAHAYGSGSSQIARFLESIKPDYIGVAHIDEGIKLRNIGVKQPILVLYTDIEDARSLSEFNLEPVVYSLSYLDKLAQLEEFELGLHIEVDTGMHRLGFDLDASETIAEKLKNSSCKVVGIMSHLSSADIPNLDSFTNSQISNFEIFANKLEESLGHPTIKHICNSVAIGRFPEAHFNMVRLGIGLYGFVIDNAKSTIELKTKIAQIKEIPAGHGIGYGNLEKADHTRKIAIIPIGYADGFDRGLGNGKWSVIVNTIACPTVGNVCMDMTMIDVSTANCNEQDEVTIIGNDASIENMSQILGTIPYEVISRISERVKRKYVSE
jgi:alanine racemase